MSKQGELSYIFKGVVTRNQLYLMISQNILAVYPLLFIIISRDTLWNPRNRIISIFNMHKRLQIQNSQIRLFLILMLLNLQYLPLRVCARLFLQSHNSLWEALLRVILNLHAI